MGSQSQKEGEKWNTNTFTKQMFTKKWWTAEAYDAWRKNKTTVGEELADIAIYLMGLSEILDIDLETEIEKKMAINKDRVYQLVDGVLTKTSSDN